MYSICCYGLFDSQLLKNTGNIHRGQAAIEEKPRRSQEADPRQYGNPHRLLEDFHGTPCCTMGLLICSWPNGGNFSKTRAAVSRILKETLKHPKANGLSVMFILFDLFGPSSRAHASQTQRHQNRS